MEVDFVKVIFRWMHIGAVIVVLGGTIFMRCVLMPAAAKIPEEVHEQLRERLMQIWKIIVHVGIALLLISGIYNFAVALPEHRGDPVFHVLMGIKILLAFGVFFLASVLVGRAPAFEKLRQNRKLWLGIVIALSAVIVLISGFLKVRGIPPAS